MTSIWMASYPSIDDSRVLLGDITSDVVVVGAGITGLLTAWRLCNAGYRVVVLEAGLAGQKNTGASTGNLYGSTSEMATLLAKWGEDVLREVTASRMHAIAGVDALVTEYGIDCGFVRTPLQWSIESNAPAERQRYARELAAYRVAGLSPHPSPGQLPFPLTDSFSVEGQAQLDPYRLCRALLDLLSRHAALFEQTQVIDIDAAASCVRTATGKVHANHIVLATHSPAGFNLLQAEMEVYREYGIAVPVQTPLPIGIHWVTDSGRSLRSVPEQQAPLLVVVGEKHRTGEWSPTQDPAGRLLKYAQERFVVNGPVAASWSAQQFKPADGLPYIGSSAHENVWVATGFQADGLTWGALAAELIVQGIEGRQPDDLAHLLSPLRITPLKSAGGWARTNATVIKHLLGDRLKAEVDDGSEIAPGSGRVVGKGEGRCALYRDETGMLHAMSPVCPHLKCIVQWNGDANSWDCPCHGSRFGPTGELLEGPALNGLARKQTPS